MRSRVVILIDIGGWNNFLNFRTNKIARKKTVGFIYWLERYICRSFLPPVVYTKPAPLYQYSLFYYHGDSCGADHKKGGDRL